MGLMDLLMLRSECEAGLLDSCIRLAGVYLRGGLKGETWKWYRVDRQVHVLHGHFLYYV
jgi:hypothetical protein